MHPGFFRNPGMQVKQEETSTVTKLKKLTITLALALASYVGFAATDPNLTGTPLTGTGVPAGNPTAPPFAPGEPVSFTLNAGNAGDTEMDFPPTGTFQLNVTIQNMGTPVIELIGGTNFFDPPVITPLGQGRFFITFVQNKAIPAGQSGTFKISGVATKDRASSGQFRVTYQANGNPGSYVNTGSDNPSSTGLIDSSLPVTLISFTAAKEGKTAQLVWETTEETNSDRFEVEKSLNGKQWEMIGKVTSNGESAVLRKYAFTDGNPAHGNNLYRLRMVDKDETFAYSRIQTVKFEEMAADLSVYPNPVTDQLFVRDFSQVTKVIIHDLNGRAVKQLGATTRTVNMQNLAEGMYIVTISRSNGLVSSQKIVVKR